MTCGPRRCRPTGCPELADLRRLTNTEFYVRHATSDGHRVVFQSGGDIWLWDAGNAAPIDIDLGGERRATMPQPIDASHQLGAISPAVDGRASAVEVRGTVSWLTHRDGPVRVLASGSTVRRRLPVVVTPGGDVAWVTDADGDDAIEVWSAADEATRTLAAGAVGRVLELVAAPDGSLLAGASHDGRLWVVTLATGELREIDRTDNGDITGLAFAPDSRWLAWSHPGPPPLAQIRVAEVAEPASDADRRDAAALRRHGAGRSAPTASTWRSCRPAASTRSTTPTCSTCRSRTAAGRSW